MSAPIALAVIGHVRSPFTEKADAPRQGVLGAEATIELAGFPDVEHALEDLAGVERIWVLCVFDRAAGSYRPKVQPPRSEVRRGVLATRSPHRPNPIGLSCVRLLAVEGRTLRVAEVDLLDGTPVLDVKPYVPYADAFPGARAGWLDDGREAALAQPAAPRDPIAPFRVVWAPAAAERLAWLEARGESLLRARVEAALGLGPAPHAYRRIRKAGAGLVLASKDWRIAFVEAGGERTLEVRALYTGYRPAELFGDGGGAPALHRAFAEAFGTSGPEF